MTAADTAAPITLDGSTLTPETLARIARERAPVVLAASARERIAAGRRVVERALASAQPVYGLTTGLGDRVGERLPDEVLQGFSFDVVRGRAMATGEALPADLVRALMVVRLNTLATGGSGASPAVAEQLLAVLAAGLVPEMPEIGSCGASDLCVMAHLGLALIGEGAFLDDRGRPAPAAEVLERHGLAPLALAPKDGLALCSNSAFSAARSALALCDAARALESAQTIAALSMEGFRANPSPLDPRAGTARPQPGQQRAAAGLLARLAGAGLLEPGAARRLQDPLSLRCLAATHGGGYFALDRLRAALEPELNGAGDNPLVLAADDAILATGNFQLPAVTVALDGLGQALAHVAVASAGRCARLLAARHSGLPANLSPHWPNGSGLAPLFKPAEALLAEIRHDAATTPAELSLGADGVEDTLVNAPLAARKLGRLVENLERLLAIEAVIAAQAVDLAGVHALLGPTTAEAQRIVRGVVPPLDTDRSLSGPLRELTERVIRSGALARAGEEQPG
ncbi:MAG: aromatic amino acid ammonia-lyase [Halofilum sp. (in: g-proteobacteria)]|nr:aromatic amino acid ammonia-lyase [Halofilum sp. (in: g-proteobacteria)]